MDARQVYNDLFCDADLPPLFDVEAKRRLSVVLLRVNLR